MVCARLILYWSNDSLIKSKGEITVNNGAIITRGSEYPDIGTLVLSHQCNVSTKVTIYLFNWMNISCKI